MMFGKKVEFKRFGKVRMNGECWHRYRAIAKMKLYKTMMGIKIYKIKISN